MITHEEARKRLLLTPLKTKDGLIVGDLYKFISDYIAQQEKVSKLLELYKELAKCLYYTDHDSLVKADNISGDILKIEEELK